MKSSLYALALGFCVSSMPAVEASGITVWAPGVSATGGWVDYDKSEADYGTVAGMCWAASASNVISWWYEQNKLTSPTSYQGKDYNPWQVFQRVWLDDGGVPSDAFNWWLKGIGTDESYNWNRMDRAEYDNTKSPNFPQAWFNGGFLSGVYDAKEYPSYISGSDSGTVYTKTAAIVGALADGYALSLSVADSARHAYTLWGAMYEETEEGLLMKEAYLTDSDDGTDQLITAQIDHSKLHNNELIFVNLTKYGTTEKVYENYSFTVSRADGLRSIPEPTTATLSLCALVGLSMRRRRL